MADKKNVNLDNMLSDNELKEVKLSDDALEQVSGGTRWVPKKEQDPKDDGLNKF